jgi:hypothetical protein
MSIIDNQMAIKAVLAIKNSDFSPLDKKDILMK